MRSLLRRMKAWWVETAEETDAGASEEQLQWLDEYYAVEGEKR